MIVAGKNQGWGLGRVLAALLAGVLLFAGCGEEEGSETASTEGGTEPAAESGPWSFTDDRGVEVSLDAPPERIIAYHTAGSALYYLGIDSQVGIFGSPAADLSEDPLLEGVDVSGMETLGQVYGEINIEKLAALEPDLIVTAYDPRQEPVLYGFKDKQQQDQVEAFAPIVAIDGLPSPVEVIGRFEDLAESLGADMQAPDLVTAREEFETGVDALRAATAEQQGLTAVATGAYGDELYFAKPADFPELSDFQNWGLDLVEPGGKEQYWDIVSFEQADKYPADMILHDTRAGALGLDALAKRPTWAGLPAVEAEQLVEWQGQPDWSYQLYGDDVEALTEAVTNADPDVVP